MAKEEEFAEVDERWLFTEEALGRALESARERAIQSLQEADSIGTQGSGSCREPPRPLSLDEGSRLVVFFGLKLPELCGLCAAPSHVRWTAVVFYRRFFTVRSPMEFDPLQMMFACVHLACKIEEAHHITLDHVLAAADFGTDTSLKAKVAGLELPLLEGLGFVLLVEPKPGAALRMLIEELRGLLAESPARYPRPPPLEDAAACGKIVDCAEGLVLELAIRSNSILRWHTSVLLAAALGVVLDEQFGRPVSECGDVQPLSDILASLLDANLEAESQRTAVRGMVETVRGIIQQRLPSMEEVTEDSVRDTVKKARRCHRAFERIRQEASERHEAHRKERKRRWSEMKGIEPLIALGRNLFK